MKIRISNVILLSILFLLCSITSVCLAQDFSSKNLIEHAKQLDGQTVTYKGEAIGDIMQRGRFVWLNVVDDHAAIGIWAPKELAESVSFTGGYKTKGDHIEIEGVFNRACEIHGGELDIHAESINKLQEGSRVGHELDPRKERTALLFLGVAVCLGILQVLRRKH